MLETLPETLTNKHTHNNWKIYHLKKNCLNHNFNYKRCRVYNFEEKGTEKMAFNLLKHNMHFIILKSTFLCCFFLI